ncbi:LrgB family protein [Colwellia psychrerythraea]|uniref:LrgB-like family protein n=1 Tax=Colwellia psychrerythraea (strain 34H / ATCC BAA-681) TaxID=167879 RepID=Q486P3_COLP3|nr:LrgB family protein [Colwellia psychrerythraea]AAZ23984.1 LrgB-like family protein [Colwellia psychrerythraea 34H]
MLTTFIVNSPILASIVFTLITIATYQFASACQQKWQYIWLNPMLFTISILVPFLLLIDINYQEYSQTTEILNLLLEPAIVALGMPLYQQFKQIRFYWREMTAILVLGITVVITVSFLLAMWLIKAPEIAIALSLKSVTTPIGITLTEQLFGDSSITAFAILIAGLFGALLGPQWLSFIGINSAKAQGLAIGSASHVIGTAVLVRKSAEHGAYSSVALILSAILTALISPWLIPLLQRLVT